MQQRQAIRALVRFHLASGLRVTIRSLVPLMIGVVAASVLYGDPLVVVRTIQALLLPGVPSAFTAAITALLFIGLATGSSRRLTPGLSGWICHLPVTGVAQRRAATAGSALTLVPLLVVLLAADLLSIQVLQTTVLRSLGLPVLGWAAALTALPTRALSRALATLAAVTAAMGMWWSLCVSIALLVVADAFAGAVTVKKRSLVRRRVRGGPFVGVPGGRLTALSFWLRVCRRALGFKIVGSWLLALLMLVPVLLFLQNNQLTAHQAGISVRITGLLAMLVVVASTAESLLTHRPPWPWSRSLGWSARYRVSLDALLLMALASPLLICVGMIRPQAAIPLLAALPWLAFTGAAALRKVGDSLSGVSWCLLTEVLVPVTAVAVWPWTAVLLVLLLPVLVNHAARAEQRQDVSRWHELHHLAAGDSLSWSNS